MITILTPSKTMDFMTPAPDFVDATEPLFPDKAMRLRSLLATYKPAELQQLMRISESLANKTTGLFVDPIKKPAFWAYDGDVFKGVQARTIDAPGAAFAQDHVLIPSAIYGLVRPYDLISPYRLEMKAKLAIDESNDLYDYWGDKLANHVTTTANGEVLMLSSYEYARAILPYLESSVRVVTPAFIDKKPNGQESQVAIYNKMMRGVMGRWVIDNRIDSLGAIRAFSDHGYVYDPMRSTNEKPVFYRPHMTPLRF